MENISNKSEKNLSVKYKNTLSYKSVSEVSEFEEPYDEENQNENENENENSGYVNRSNNNNKKSDVNQPKLNESIHSVISNFSKDIFEVNENEIDDNNNSLKKI